MSGLSTEPVGDTLRHRHTVRLPDYLTQLVLLWSDQIRPYGRNSLGGHSNLIVLDAAYALSASTLDQISWERVSSLPGSTLVEQVASKFSPELSR